MYTLSRISSLPMEPFYFEFSLPLTIRKMKKRMKKIIGRKRNDRAQKAQNDDSMFLRCYLLKCFYFIFECNGSKNTWTVIEFHSKWDTHICPEQIAFDQHFLYISIRRRVCTTVCVWYGFSLSYHILLFFLSPLPTVSISISIFVFKQFPYIKYKSHYSPHTLIQFRMVFFRLNG